MITITGRYRAIVLAYNIPGVTNLTLTREQIVGIYNGSINNWSDPTFVEHNPGIDLPANATIVPMGRCGSSSTEIFTRALSSFSDAWAVKYGVFDKKAGWNDCVVNQFAQRNSEMADTIQREPYYIGFMTPSSAVEVNLPFASIINQRGRVTVGDKRSVQAAMEERARNMSSRLTSNLEDCEGDETYPIAGYSYFIVRTKHEGNCSAAIELARYIEWFLTSAQAEAAVDNHLMVPVNLDLAKRIRVVVLERMTCNGRQLMDLVRHQKYEEEESLKTWKLPIYIVTPLTAGIILLLIAYAIRQKVKYLRMLNHDKWKINFFEIDFAIPKKRCQTMSNASDLDEDAATASKNYFGRFNTHEVVMTPLSIAPVFNVNRKVKKALMNMREEIAHENVARFFGISWNNNAIYLVEQYCANGTLIDFFGNNKFSVNQSFRYIVCADIANGMAYLHRQNLIHGNLSIDKCYVDSRWTIKIVDWEYTTLYDVVRRIDRIHTQITREQNILHFLCGDESPAFRYLAPEIQKGGCLSEPTRAGDVYSFGIIIRDVFINLPGQELHQTTGKVCDKMPAKARQIMELACHEIAIERPTFEQLEKSMRSAIRLISSTQRNLLDRCVRT